MLIIFDLDDTLIDTSGFVTPFKLKESLLTLISTGVEVEDVPNAYSELLKENQKHLKSRQALISFAKTKKATDHQIEKALHSLSSPLPDTFSIPMTPNAKEVLEYFCSKATLSLVTLGKPSFQKEKLKKAGIDSSIFSMIRVLEEPQKKIAYEEIQDFFLATPKDVWVCGDRVETDLKPAFDLGFHTVHMRWGRGERCWQEKWIDHTIGDLKELKEIIR